MASPRALQDSSDENKLTEQTAIEAPVFFDDHFSMQPHISDVIPPKEPPSLGQIPPPALVKPIAVSPPVVIEVKEEPEVVERSFDDTFRFFRFNIARWCEDFANKLCPVEETAARNKIK